MLLVPKYGYEREMVINRACSMEMDMPEMQGC